jgi:hypothetical protein
MNLRLQAGRRAGGRAGGQDKGQTNQTLKQAHGGKGRPTDKQAGRQTQLGWQAGM